MSAILAKFKGKTPLTDDEKAFVNAVPIPAVAYMLQHLLAYSETLANALIDLTSEVAGAMIAWHMIEEYIGYYEAGQSKIGTLCGKSYADIAEQIKQVRASREVIFTRYTKGLEMQTQFLTFMASIDARVAANASHTISKALAWDNGK